jgi:hypothetical protein
MGTNAPAAHPRFVSIREHSWIACWIPPNAVGCNWNWWQRKAYFGMYKRSRLWWMLGMDTQNEQGERMEKLAERLMAHPQMSEPIEAMLEMVEREIHSGSSADAVEEAVVGQVRALGRAALQRWAEQAAAGARPQESQPGKRSRRHAKKNSGG